MHKTRLILVLLMVLLVPVMAGAQGKAPDFVTGNLGSLGDTSNDAAVRANAQRAMQGLLVSHLGARGHEAVSVRGISRDEVGAVHVRFDQTLNGLDVEGGGLVLHAHADGNIFAVNGQLVTGDLPRRASVSADTALAFALGQAGIAADAGPASLVYVLGADGNGHLAWKATVDYVDEHGPQRDFVFADATTGELAARHPQFKYARSLNTQDCNQKTKNCTTVSTSPNTINTGDAAIDAAHNYAIATYNYYWLNQGRDSIDDNGMTLISRVHYDRNYNNAFWDGSQMTYGDGDGTTFIPLSQDADVVAHELTHGVTERSSALIYQNESGALNEAWSDIFGALVDRQEGASITDTWLLGEDIYTPGTPGDALRVMNDPASVGDYDYYPTRYTGTSDNGGVHWNSGIANLAFVLLVEGGTHPRGKTSVVVPALDNNFDVSLNMAGDIFYWANVNCMVSSTNFEGARNCTAAGANTLYGTAAYDAVHLAWDAVGVPGGGGTPPGPGCDPPYSDSISNLSGGVNSEQNFTQVVPACANTVTISIAGGSGDADLYVKFGSAPTTSDYDCRPYLSGNNETCTLAGQEGTYYIMIRGYRKYSGVTLTAAYE